MSELIEFPKSISLEENKGWKAVCEAAKRDFTSTGFPHLAEDFLIEFRPFYEELLVDLKSPVITEETEQHIIWKSQLDSMVLDLQHFFGRLVRDRYLRELKIFCEKNLS